jgi:hypothetical protein
MVTAIGKFFPGIYSCKNVIKPFKRLNHSSQAKCQFGTSACNTEIFQDKGKQVVNIKSRQQYNLSFFKRLQPGRCRVKKITQEKSFHGLYTGQFFFV